MPQYEFEMPKIQEILDALERSKNQSQQERPTAAEIVTDATMQGVNNANAAVAQQQQAIQQQQAAQQQQALQQQAPPQPQQIPQQPQPPLQQRPLTQLDLLLANDLIGSKEAYEGADVLAKAKAPQGADEAAIKTIADEIRNSAHGDAENTRKLASVVGVDLSPYGEGVTLDDARFNLKSRQVKEIADIMSGQGQYGRTADQYHQDEFYNLIAQGKSAREAREIAGERAQRYQADRLGYLRNAYNVHGRDGNYTNDIGVGILDAIAQENPAVAKVYATAYKIPKEAQNRYEQLEDTHLNEMFKQGSAARQFLYQYMLDDQTFGHNLQLHNLDSKLRREEAQWQSDLDFNRAIKTYKFKTEEERKAKFQSYKDIIAICTSLGMSQEDAKACGLASIGIKIPKKGEEADAATVENMTKLYDALDKTEKNLLKELEDKAGFPVDAKRAADIEAKIDQIRAHKESLLGLGYAKMGITGLGKQPEELTDVNEFSPDDAVNNQSLAQLWQLSKGDMDTFKRYVSTWLDESGVTPRFKAQYLENLEAPLSHSMRKSTATKEK